MEMQQYSSTLPKPWLSGTCDGDGKGKIPEVLLIAEFVRSHVLHTHGHKYRSINAMVKALLP